MEITVMNLTLSDISEAVRSELNAFFQGRSDQKDTIDEIGGIGLAVEITGLAKATIYSRVSMRTIPHRKQGKKLYFSRKELNDWIDKGRRKTREEIASDSATYFEDTMNKEHYV